MVCGVCTVCGIRCIVCIKDVMMSAVIGFGVFVEYVCIEYVYVWCVY